MLVAVYNNPMQVSYLTDTNMKMGSFYDLALFINFIIVFFRRILDILKWNERTQNIGAQTVAQVGQKTQGEALG